ncbi:hypothetical protein LCGC14_2676150, partial [marine sediment metagenome]
YAAGEIVFSTGSSVEALRLASNQAATFSSSVSMGALTATAGTFSSIVKMSQSFDALRLIGDGVAVTFYNAAESARSGYLRIQSAVAAVLNVQVNQALGIWTNNTIRLTIEADGDFDFKTGKTKFNTVEYTWPASDGGSGDRLQTDGAGGLSWVTP